MSRKKPVSGPIGEPPLHVIQPFDLHEREVTDIRGQRVPVKVALFGGTTPESLSAVERLLDGISAHNDRGRRR